MFTCTGSACCSLETVASSPPFFLRMNTTTMGLLASLLCTSTALASTDDAWMQLDQEIASLSTNAAAEGGVTVSGNIANFLTIDSDTDTAGWAFESVRLNFKAKYEQFGIKISTDLKSGTSDLKDAFVTWDATEEVTMTWGQFKRPFSYHFGLGSGNLLFALNTINAKNEARDNGVMLNGSFSEGKFDWALAAQNGLDSTGDDLRYTARLAADVVGEGAFRKYEGAIQTREELDVSLGLAYAHDKSATKGFHKVGLEAAATINGLYLAVDVADYQADDPGTVLDATFGHDLDETTPFSLTASYMLSDDVELAARLEDFDDGVNTDRTTIGLNFYQVLPHMAKWTINYVDTSSDTPANESDLIRVGLILNF
jgi:hypothetical protein